MEVLNERLVAVVFHRWRFCHECAHCNGSGPLAGGRCAACRKWLCGECQAHDTIYHVGFNCAVRCTDTWLTWMDRVQAERCTIAGRLVCFRALWRSESHLCQGDVRECRCCGMNSPSCQWHAYGARRIGSYWCSEACWYLDEQLQRRDDGTATGSATTRRGSRNLTIRLSYEGQRWERLRRKQTTCNTQQILNGSKQFRFPDLSQGTQAPPISDFLLAPGRRLRVRGTRADAASPHMFSPGRRRRVRGTRTDAVSPHTSV